MSTISHMHGTRPFSLSFLDLGPRLELGMHGDGQVVFLYMHHKLAMKQ